VDLWVAVYRIHPEMHERSDWIILAGYKNPNRMQKTCCFSVRDFLEAGCISKEKIEKKQMTYPEYFNYKIIFTVLILIIFNEPT
jgi:hypothetical protein